MPKQSEPCVFCGELPCECNGPVTKKARPRRVRPAKPDVPAAVEPAQDSVSALRRRRDGNPVQDSVPRVRVRPSRKHRVDDLVPALRALNFHGLLAPEEQAKYADQLKLEATGKLKEV